LALLGNVGNPVVVLEIGQIQAAARTLGLEVITLEIRRGEDIVPSFEALNGRAEALYVILDAIVSTHRFRINTLAPMDQTSQTYSGAPVTTSTRFCVERSQATFRSNSRPSSTSFST
jgi:ABC-type uncharacterized transport system substrate-binding protein